MSTLSRLLKESWTLVEAERDKVAGYFHDRWLLSSPHLRDQFPAAPEAVRIRLLHTVVTAVQNIDDPERFEEYLRSFGRDRGALALSPEYYRAFGAALLDALRAFAGVRWTVEYDRAWRDAYQMISQRIMAGARDDGTRVTRWPAEVLTHQRRGSTLAVFTCRPTVPIGYQAGQYVRIESGHLPRQWRPYSIANAPRADGTLDFHVRALGTGGVSDALVHQVKPGDVLRLAEPAGTATLDRRSSRDIVCVAGGTGLAPVKALVQELTRYNRTRWVHLFLGARTRSDLYDLPDLRHLAARYPWLSLVPALSEDPGYPGECGTVADVVARYQPWTGHDFFVAGPAAMVRATLRRLDELRVPASDIRYDLPNLQAPGVSRQP